ncbi:MAG: hypothetical protein HXL00_05350 [Candidatus Nanosynbacter sp.]|nr:hypothetical protein [Candidatus Nanosynbacter sp.]
MNLSLQRILCLVGVILLFGIALVYSPPVHARVDLNGKLSQDDACDKATDGDGNDACHAVTSSAQSSALTPMVIVTRGINIALVVLGGVSALMIVYAGFRFTLASGDPQAVKAARNTILYAVAGLVVAILAYSIVNWITDNLSIT